MVPQAHFCTVVVICEVCGRRRVAAGRGQLAKDIPLTPGAEFSSPNLELDEEFLNSPRHQIAAELSVS